MTLGGVFGTTAGVLLSSRGRCLLSGSVRCCGRRPPRAELLYDCCAGVR